MSDRFNIDSKAVKELAELLQKTGLSEIEYEVDAGRIRVAKNAPTVVAPPPSPVTPEILTVAATQTPSTEMAVGAVKSPMVGTAYLAPSPGAPSFVKAGDAVAKGDTLLIIEAMKVMNPIRAPQAGKISKILIEDASPVEFGSPLMVIE